MNNARTNYLIKNIIRNTYICVVLLGVLGKYGNLLYMLMLLFSSFTSKMLVICVVGGRLVERFRGNFFFSGSHFVFF